MTAPLILLAFLVLPYLVLRPFPGLRERPSLRGSIGLALLFFVAGASHFVADERMAEMLPPAVPWRLAIVHASGVFEVLLGVALLPAMTRRAAGWGAIALLVAFLPANIYAAVARVPFGGHEWGPVYLWVRVPVQIVIGAWAWWFAVRGDDSSSSPRAMSSDRETDGRRQGIGDGPERG